MKIDCPLDYVLVSPSDLNYGAAEVLSGEKKFGDRIMKYTLLDPQTPGVYDLIIKTIVPTSTLPPFEKIITIKFTLTRNCEEGVFNQINLSSLDVYPVPMPILFNQSSPYPGDPEEV